MKQLFLLRHAKSSWDDPALSDFERPLNRRGREAAPFMGELIAKKMITPEIVISSPAVRARQTAELFKDAAGLQCPFRFERAIYDASLTDLRTIVTELEEEYVSALLVGHQPGTRELIRFLTGESPEVPTACFASRSLNVDNWADIRNGSGKLELILRPKEEMKRES